VNFYVNYIGNPYQIYTSENFGEQEPIPVNPPHLGTSFIICAADGGCPRFVPLQIDFNQQQSLTSNFRLPPAAIVMSVAEDPMNGFQSCDGSYHSTSEYPQVFEVIGKRYGDVRNSYYRFPDFSNRIPKGVYPGEKGGSERVILDERHIPPHEHRFSIEYDTTGQYFDPTYNAITAEPVDPFNLLTGRVLTDAVPSGNFTLETTTNGGYNHLRMMPRTFALNFFLCVNGTGCGAPCPLRLVPHP
jgi:microcystin-dependent protein